MKEAITMKNHGGKNKKGKKKQEKKYSYILRAKPGYSFEEVKMNPTMENSWCEIRDGDIIIDLLPMSDRLIRTMMDDKCDYITKQTLEKELKRLKLLQEKKRSSSYTDGQIAEIRKLLKIMDERYEEPKELLCPYRKTDYRIFSICIEEECRMWNANKNDCGLKR